MEKFQSAVDFVLFDSWLAINYNLLTNLKQSFCEKEQSESADERYL